MSGTCDIPILSSKLRENTSACAKGQMGNSEVGHFEHRSRTHRANDTSRIDHAIETGEFFNDDALIQAMEHANSRRSALHLMGLVSQGGVHSSQQHLYACLRMAKERNVERVFVHAFLDGRDTAPDSGAGYVAELLEKMAVYDIGGVGSLVGRYYANGPRQAVGADCAGISADALRRRAPAA